jgi:hypothetical protein
MSLRRRIIRLAATLTVVASLWACNAPFIPVPPPAATFTPLTVSDNAGGMKTVWITEGPAFSPAAGAAFSVYNLNLGRGVIVEANADGSYQAPPMDGAQGDRIRIYFTTPAQDASQDICQVLTPGPGVAPFCGN